jgi:sugar/nucleoside kinase (ribokinase family)
MEMIGLKKKAQGEKDYWRYTKWGERSPKAPIAKRFHEIGVRTVVVKLGDRGLSLVLMTRSQRSQ